MINAVAALIGTGIAGGGGAAALSLKAADHVDGNL
jgi:hypothetical protein